LDKGIYGFHMAPIYGEVPTRSRHYAALADYASAREGTHVFFFLKRTIVYGGQIIGSKDYGAFYLNGPYTPMGRLAGSDVYWDESVREIYSPTDKKGVFTRPNLTPPNKTKVCQPYFMRFEDRLGLQGNAILSDQLYFEVGEFPYPLPSNSISGMSFCTLTPGETEIALSLLKNEPIRQIGTHSDEDVNLIGDPIPFEPKYGISSLSEAVSESHLEASVIANPDLLPDYMRPKGATICRQIPISPFKPSQMDRADICYYTEDSIREGTIPNTVIELKNKNAGKRECEQVVRYLDWLYKRLGDEASKIQFYMLAPSYAKTASIPKKYDEQVELISFGDGSK
jgi:hypothetical protein